MVYKIPTEGIATGAVDTTLLNSNVTNALVPPKGIIMFYGTENEIPTGWYLCDGNNGTPDLTDKFVIGTATIDENDNKWKSDVDGTAKSEGGEATKLLGTANLPSHTHTAGTLTGSNTHSHGIPRGSGGSQADTSPYVPSPVVEQIGTAFQTEDETIDVDITGNTGSQGGTMGEAFDILPPFYALAYIMRG